MIAPSQERGMSYDLAGLGYPTGVALVTVTSTAQTLVQLLTQAGQLSNAVPANSRFVYIQPRGGDIKYTDDGQTPVSGSSGLGIDIYDQTAFPLAGELSKILLIGSSNVTTSLAFYR